MSYVQACPSEINEQGQCSEPLIWVSSSKVEPLTYAEFAQILPALVGVLFVVWGIKQLLRMIFNTR